MPESIAPARSSTDTPPSTAQIVHDAVVHWLRTEGGVATQGVDLDASLLTLGVDSMGIATIGESLERTTGKKLHPDVVFELETIRELAEYLDGIPAHRATPPTTAAAATTVRTQESSPSVEAIAEAATTSQSQAVPAERETTFDPVAHYERLNRRVRVAKQQGVYFFEPEISAHDGAWVDVEGRRMLMLSSYEYLGLLGHPHLHETAVAALEKYGTGHHGARLLVGTTSVHKRLEARLATLMDADDAITFSSGYVANLATISALVGPGDCILGDQFNHASIVDGCRMSGAEFLEFKHNDAASLAELLKRTAGRRTLVIVDAVFSMEGDIVDLPEIVTLCKKHRALLMVDEAHSVGVLGDRGRGIQEHFDLPANAIDIKMGTLSKSLAGSGGFVAGREELITYLRHHARGYIFSGALPACQAAVSIAALDVLEQKPELVEQLWENVDRYLGGLKTLGFDTAACETPIVPIMSGDEAKTLAMTHLCRAEGLLVVPVCFPAVPMDAPRLRTCVSAVHTSDDIDFALAILARAGRQTGLIA
ncbi:MAG: aminotransferase class I/II-fold pyridoxal phosphate-dependent enzyme [Pirellulales bacterium]